MAYKAGFGILVVLAAAAGLPVANAQTAVAVCGQESHNNYSGDFDGRFYQVVVSSGISWDDARTAAEATTSELGVQGQLATINSHAEDEFIHCLLQATEGAAGEEAWAGGFQEECEDEPGCGWTWLNGEPIAPENTDSPYTNWQAGEPNNDTAPEGNERHLGVGLGGNFGWNDEGRPGNIGAYVVEFGDALPPVAAATCAAGGPGCPIGQEQTITYPAGAVVQGNVEVRTWTIDHPDLVCGQRDAPFVVSLVAEDGDLVIPIHLCSEDGRIVVNRTDSPSVVIQRGVVQIVNQNETYGCDDPITDGDPTNEDAVVYRPTLATDALENGFVTGVNANFVGNAHDFQNGCVNPSRGSGGKGSYFIDRLRIHFGSEEPAFVQAQMELLQGDKLRVLQAAVNAARPALRRVDWLALRVLTDAAIFLHGRGNYAAALFKIRVLLALNDRVRYAVILGQNPNGEIKYRALNIEDMYRRRIIPLAP